MEEFLDPSLQADHPLANLELISIGPQLGVDDEVDIYLDGQQVGIIELGVNIENGSVAVWDFRLHEDKRGSGYGKASRALLIPYIIETYPWVKSIYSSISSTPAIRSAISTPIPDGWTRQFRIFGPDSQNDDFKLLGFTTNPDEALGWIEGHLQEIADEQYYAVGVEYIKPQEI